MNNISLILQREPTECALACLAMILNHFKSKLDINSLRQRFAVSLRGTSLAEVVKMAHACKLSTRVYYLNLTELAALSHPCILYWNNNHYVVFAGMTKKYIKIYDPALGYQEYTDADFAKHFTGLVLTLAPASDYMPITVSSDHRFLKQLLPLFSVKSLLVIMVLTLLMQAFMLCFPYALQLILIEANSVPNLIGLALCLMKLSEAAIYFVRGLAITQAEKILHQQVSLLVVNHLFAMPYQYFRQRTAASVSARLAALDKVRQAVHSFSVGIIDGLLSLTLLMVLFCHQMTIACWVLIASSLYFCFHLRISKASGLVEQLQANAKSTERCYLQESILGLYSIKSANKHVLRVKQWHNLLTLTSHQHARLAWLQARLESVRMIAFGMIQIVVLCYLNNKSYSLIFYVFLYTRTVTEFTQKTADLLQLRVVLAQFSDVIHHQQLSPITYEANSDALVSLGHVTFRFDESSRFLLEHIHLQIKQGDLLLIKGISGSGKSTLMKLMLGMLSPTSGSVVYREALQVATVLQEDVLFSGTILENIASFTQVDTAMVIDCARLVELHDFIESLPMGYHTYLTPESQHLSGGQKQRVLLARALYHQPRLLFLDEACSMLDIAAERRIYAMIKERGITCVIITHRPDAAIMANNIYIIPN